MYILFIHDSINNRIAAFGGVFSSREKAESAKDEWNKLNNVTNNSQYFADFINCDVDDLFILRVKNEQL